MNRADIELAMAALLSVESRHSGKTAASYRQARHELQRALENIPPPVMPHDRLAICTEEDAAALREDAYL